MIVPYVKDRNNIFNIEGIDELYLYHLSGCYACEIAINDIDTPLTPELPQ